MSKKELAIKKAKELDIDRYIRIIAMSGKDEDGRKINFFNEWEGCSVRIITQGGTNSASIFFFGDNTLEGSYIYYAEGYGKRIQIFKFGPWVHRLISKAKEILAVNEAKEESKFQEIDF